MCFRPRKRAAGKIGTDAPMLLSTDAKDPTSLHADRWGKSRGSVDEVKYELEGHVRRFNTLDYGRNWTNTYLRALWQDEFLMKMYIVDFLRLACTVVLARNGAGLVAAAGQAVASGRDPGIDSA